LGTGNQLRNGELGSCSQKRHSCEKKDSSNDTELTNKLTSTQAFFYGQTLDLSACILQAHKDGFAQYLRVYTDKLLQGESNVIDAASSPLRAIHIFAPDFLLGDTDCDDLRIIYPENGIRLFIFNEEALPCLNITYLDKNGAVKGELELFHANSGCPGEVQGQTCTKLHNRLAEEDAGREIVLSDKEVHVRPVRNVSRLELAGPSFEDSEAFPDIDKAGYEIDLETTAYR
jgi:hypothetical protein